MQVLKEQAFVGTEEEAFPILEELAVDYVVVIFGGHAGYGSDDMNKFPWMLRIAEASTESAIREDMYYSPTGEFRIDGGGTPWLLNSLLYKLSYYRFAEVFTEQGMY